jgi:hypothetical protein
VSFHSLISRCVCSHEEECMRRKSPVTSVLKITIVELTKPLRAQTRSMSVTAIFHQLPSRTVAFPCFTSLIPRCFKSGVPTVTVEQFAVWRQTLSTNNSQPLQIHSCELTFRRLISAPICMVR